MIADDLVAASVRAMLANQRASGAFVASPDFGQYRYCWLRDASFIAYGLDLAGEAEASARYHEWAARAITGVATRIDAAICQARSGRMLDPAEMPPTRFDLEGAPVGDDWPNFQVDGYGTWLWALREHTARNGADALVERLAPVVDLTARFVSALALTACFDVWEEDGGSVHTSTLACVYGGLVAAADLLGDDSLSVRADDVKAHVLEHTLHEGRFRKSSATPSVDASLLWLARPFGLVEVDDPVFAATADAIEDELDLDGGIRRYPEDTYYGGGAWPVLAASLGWVRQAAGHREAAMRRCAWIESCFDAEGRLGEQFGGDRRDPLGYAEWRARWGHPARDLLWSHAMYVVLADAVSGDPTVNADRSEESGREEGRT